MGFPLSIIKVYSEGVGLYLLLENLTNDEGDWKMVPGSSLVLVKEELDVHFEAIKF